MCSSLSNQNCMIQPILINLHPNEYNLGFRYYSLAVKLGRCDGISNTINDLSNKACVLNKSEESNLSVLSMITRINESKTLSKHISCESNCKFDRKKCNSGQW